MSTRHRLRSHGEVVRTCEVRAGEISFREIGSVVVLLDLDHQGFLDRANHVGVEPRIAGEMDLRCLVKLKLPVASQNLIRADSVVVSIGCG